MRDIMFVACIILCCLLLVSLYWPPDDQESGVTCDCDIQALTERIEKLEAENVAMRDRLTELERNAGACPW